MTDAELSWARLKPEDRVRVAIEMTNVVTQICADGVKETHPKITDEELISLLRRRFSFGRRPYSEE